MSNACPECKSTRLQSAVLSAKLEPAAGGLMKMAGSVEVRASACMDCGKVELRADPENLKILAIGG